jgi:PAS domain S-box-containing protein
VIRVDRKRNIVFMNKAAQKYTGWDEQDAILQPVDAVFNIIDPKTREKVECCFAEMIDSGKACFGYCPILISKSGSERYISVNVSPVEYENGQVSGAVITFQDVPINISGKTNGSISAEDVTKYRIMEENLRRSRNFNWAIFEDFPAKIWILTKDRKIDYANKRLLKFAGVETHQELDRVWMRLVHQEDLSACRHAIEKAFEKKEPFNFELRIKCSDGEFRWVANYTAPYHDADGNFAGYIGAFNDITEQKQAQDVLKKYEMISEKATV